MPDFSGRLPHRIGPLRHHLDPLRRRKENPPALLSRQSSLRGIRPPMAPRHGLPSHDVLLSRKSLDWRIFGGIVIFASRRRAPHVRVRSGSHYGMVVAYFLLGIDWVSGSH